MACFLFGASVTGGGGSVAGSDKQIQFNDGGDFGANSNFIFDKIKASLGIQTSSPEAPLHIDSVIGQTLDAPASISLSTSIDTVIDSPATYSVSQVSPPSIPSSPVINLIQIDYVNGVSTSYAGTGLGNYIANGQTITYLIYAYRNPTSVLPIVTGNYYTTTFTDTINDGSTQFTIQISSISTSLGNYDGFIIRKSYDGGSSYPYTIDIGNNTTYVDDDFTTTDVYDNSSYLENGGSWAGTISQYKTIDGTPYRNDYISNSVSDSNQSQYLIVVVSSYGSLVDDGFLVQHVNGYFYDISANTSYLDYGQSSGNISDASLFSTIAFPQFNISLTGCNSTSASFSYGGGSFTADGSTWTIELWEYRTNIDSNQWFVSTPDTYNLGADDNSFNNFNISWSTTIGDGTGHYFVVKQNGIVVYEYDASTNASGNDSGSSSIISKPDISSYSGISRTFNAYGYITSPTTKYSSTHIDQSFTDDNSAPYVIQHDLTGFGNAVYLKILETSYRGTGNFYNSSIISTYLQTYTSLGDGTVTPNSVGFLADGRTFNYSVYANKSVNGTAIYSPSIVGAITLPNNGLSYTVGVSYATVSGATYKIKRQIGSGSNEYRTDGGTSYTDSTVVSYGASSTLTPTQAIGSTVIFDWDSATLPSTEPVIRIRNKINSIPAFLEFQYSVGAGSYGSGAKYGVVSTGNASINAYNGGLEIGAYNSPHTQISLTQNTIFNKQASNQYRTHFKGSSVTYLAYFDTGYDTAFFGHSSTTFGGDPTATVYIEPNGSDKGLVLSPTPGSNDASVLAELRNSSNSVYWTLTNGGRMSIRTNSNSNANLRIGSGDGVYTQLLLDNTSSLPSPIAGGIEYQSGVFYGTNASSVRKAFLQALASSTSTYYWRSDTNGNPIADTILQVQSGVVLVATIIFQAKQGIALDASKDLSIGTNGTLTLSSGVNVITNTSTGTKFGTSTTQKLAFHGATAVIQRAGASQVAVATTAPTNVAPFGFTTSAQATAIFTLLNEIRSTLVEKGIMKGSA